LDCSLQIQYGIYQTFLSNNHIDRSYENEENGIILGTVFSTTTYLNQTIQLIEMQFSCLERNATIDE
jgi:hypothetical protein